MATTQYIGSRYVPLFADPIEWSGAKSYEPLTIVTHEGNSYTSKQSVPVGIDIDNGDYWVVTGNYNAQVELYRRETVQAQETADTAKNDIETLLPKSAFSAETPVKDYIDNLVSEHMDCEYGEYSFTGSLGNKALVHYAKIPAKYKPKLRIANEQVNTTEHEINIAHRNKSIVLVNAGVFNTSTLETEGIVISDSNILKNTTTALSDRTNIFMTDDGRLHYGDSSATAEQLKESYDPVWAVTSFYPFIVSGQFTQSQRTANDFQPRTCIAQDIAGNYCVFACAGRMYNNAGMSIYDMRDFLNQIGFAPYFAYNLDGGASSSLSVMGVRTNSLTDNNHRPVANCLSFEIEDSETLDTTFDGNFAIAQMLIELNTFKPNIYATSIRQFAPDGASISNTIYNVDKSTSDYVYTAMLVESFQQSNGLYRIVAKAGTDGQSQQALALNTQYKEAYTYGKRILTHNKVNVLAWASRNPATSYEIANTPPANTVRLLAMFQQSGRNFPVQLYQYNFGENANYRNFSGFSDTPHGEAQNFTVTFDFDNNQVQYSYTTTESIPNISLQSLFALEYF